MIAKEFIPSTAITGVSEREFLCGKREVSRLKQQQGKLKEKILELLGNFLM